MQFFSDAANIPVYQHHLDNTMEKDIYSVPVEPCFKSSFPQPEPVHIMWVSLQEGACPNHIIPMFSNTTCMICHLNQIHSQYTHAFFIVTVQSKSQNPMQQLSES